MQGIKYDRESVQSLNLYSQFIEVLSQELLQFLEHGVQKQFENGKITSEDAEYFEKVISSKLDQHNNVLAKLESEISKRVKKKFPSVISFNQLKRLGEKLDRAIADNQQNQTPDFN